MTYNFDVRDNIVAVCLLLLLDKKVFFLKTNEDLQSRYYYRLHKNSAKTACISRISCKLS